jgi:hypothetical protein
MPEEDEEDKESKEDERKKAAEMLAAKMLDDWKQIMYGTIKSEECGLTLHGIKYPFDKMFRISGGPFYTFVKPAEMCIDESFRPMFESPVDCVGANMESDFEFYWVEAKWPWLVNPHGVPLGEVEKVVAECISALVVEYYTEWSEFLATRGETPVVYIDSPFGCAISALKIKIDTKKRA